MRALAIATAATILLVSPASAEGFLKVDDKNMFVSLMQDRALKRLGITVQVTEDGRINGRAFGYDVSGVWNWEGGYFCRDLSWGGDPLGFNCQMVQVNGNTVRFISDRGAGQYADLRLD